jgi:hypothetical protein
MVRASLVEQDLKDGKRLLETLDKPKSNGTSFRVKAAFWLYRPESMEWRLVLATPLVDEKGPLATYVHLGKVLDSIQLVGLSTHNISVVSPRDPLVKAFRGALRIAPDSAGVRFTRNVVGGTYVEDAYLYRLP